MDEEAQVTMEGEEGRIDQELKTEIDMRTYQAEIKGRSQQYLRNTK